MIEPFGDEYYMRRALEQAKIGLEKGEIPVGCVVVCNKQIVASAHNFTQTLNDVTAHAEMQAITAAANLIGAKYLKDCVMYVTLEPCAMCAGALGWSQIGKIVYGAPDVKKGFRKYAPEVLHPKTEVVSGILQTDVELILKKFFVSRRKK